MFKGLKRSVKQLRRDEPGHRFRNRHERSQKDGGPGFWARLALYAAAVLAIAIGIVLVFIPGPAVLFFFFAGGLLATESGVIARWMDKGEMLVRSVVRRLRGLRSGG